MSPFSLYRRLRYSPFLAQMVIVRRCNLACAYCNEFDSTSKPVALEELKRRLDKLEELGTWAVELTGGEPLLHPDVAELIEYAKSLRFRKVMMISNGYLMSPAVIEKLNRAGLDELQISVDGVVPTDVTVKVLRPLRRKLEHLRRYAKFEVVVSAVIGSSSPEEAVEVVRFARDHRFRPRALLIHDDQGRLKLGPDELVAYQEVKRLIGFHWKDFVDYRDDLIRAGVAPFKCRAGSRYLYVDEFGNVHWCSQTRGVFVKPLSAYTAEDLRTQYYTRKSCSDTCTVGCVRTCSNPDALFAQPLGSGGSSAEIDGHGAPLKGAGVGG